MPRTRSNPKTGLIIKIGAIWAMGLLSLLFGMNLLYGYVTPQTSVNHPPKESSDMTTASTARKNPTATSIRTSSDDTSGREIASGPFRTSSGAPRSATTEGQPDGDSSGTRVVETLNGKGPRTITLRAREPDWGVRWKSSAWFFSVYVKDAQSSETLDVIGPVHNESTQGSEFYDQTGNITVRIKAMGTWTLKIVKKT